LEPLDGIFGRFFNSIDIWRCRRVVQITCAACADPSRGLVSENKDSKESAKDCVCEPPEGIFERFFDSIDLALLMCRAIYV
jgi:hypothetical protein